MLHLSPLLACLLAAAIAGASDLPEHRMVHRRAVDAVRRQASSISVEGGGTTSPAAGGVGNGGNGGNNGGGNNASPTTTSPTTSPDNGGGLPGVISSIVDPKTTTTAAVPTITLPASTSRPATSKASSVGPTVVQITQTSTALPSSVGSASIAAASASSTAPASSSGISGGTLIAIIVVASCVGGVAAIWTIIRKWKLGPSRRFEDKLQPVDFFDPGADARTGTGFDARLPATGSGAALSRVDSNGSSGYGGVGSTTKLVRGDSLGSASGSQRGGRNPGMSEASYAQGLHGYRPPAAYPPATAPGQQPYAPPRGPGALANPYADYYDNDATYAPAAPGGGYARY